MPILQLVGHLLCMVEPSGPMAEGWAGVLREKAESVRVAPDFLS